jgi:hypothetical protein
MRVAVLVCFLSGCGAVFAPKCVNDGDCDSGLRCNTAFEPPSCQPLYAGVTDALCSDDYFCVSKTCRLKRCLDVSAGAPLGNVVPATVHHKVSLGAPTTVLFTDDARNDCASWTTGIIQGHTAMVSLSATTGQLADGQRLTWATDADVRAGRVSKPFAAFVQDDLSGVDLKAASGTFVINHLPTSSDPGFRFQLLGGGIDATFTSVLCP